jgi:polysaccharide deacetylase 2 family uncharacterized protein YibQ
VTLGHDDLIRPLGLEPARAPRRVTLPLGQVFVGFVASMFMALAAYLVFVKDPFGGEPYAIAVVERARRPDPLPPQVPVQQAPDAPDQQASAGTPGQQSAADAERETGVRVVRGGAGETAQGVVIRVPTPPVKLAAAPDRRLVERSRHGSLPRIGADGARPADVYARPAPQTPARVGRIAIVVGGLGLSQSMTSDAVSKLPGPVTLAFAPYGPELERQVARAREDGHEVMLQVPMEPFDYPDNDPGPHTLTASAQPAETLDRLHWVMSRFTGYVGIINYMGARFTSSEPALTPVLKDIATRGLMVLDDGSSPRSLIGSTAQALKLPASRGDTVVDTVPKASAIDDQLARLETIARERGSAIGVASGLPLTVERLVQWSRGLEARGFVLVPVSAAVARPGRS